MLRLINAFVFLAIVLMPSVTLAESASVYVENVSCEGSPFGLRLPPHLPEVMKLDSIAREEVQQIEKWDGYTTTRKYIEFRGFTLGLVTFSNDPNRYMVSFAEITSSRWSHIAPFRVGESLKSVRRKLGSSAAHDPELKAKYGSEAGDVSFQHAHGKISKVTYACYTGYELDISGGNALTSTEDFEKLTQDNRNVYWAKDTNDALRVVVREIPVGWRGDMYDLYLLDAAVAKDDFLNSINSASGRTSYQPVVSYTWRPPLVFQRHQHKTKWFIDVGQPFQILSDWRVFSSKDRGAICTIAFSSPGNDAAARLPRPLTRLARKLDEALGPGNDEGTLQPTARTRLDGKHVLANAALRPWALVDGNAYNSRSEVDAGLEDWSKANGSRQRLYSEILKEYPTAERSLATYYARAYGLQPAKARETAAWVTDLVFRSFFVFSKGQSYFRYQGVRTNPWPLEQ